MGYWEDEAERWRQISRIHEDVIETQIRKEKYGARCWDWWCDKGYSWEEYQQFLRRL